MIVYAHLASKMVQIVSWIAYFLTDNAMVRVTGFFAANCRMPASWCLERRLVVSINEWVAPVMVQRYGCLIRESGGFKIRVGAFKSGYKHEAMGVVQQGRLR